MQQQQVLAVQNGMKANGSVSLPAPYTAPSLSPDVMIEAMKFSRETGQPLDVVIAALTGSK